MNRRQFVTLASAAFGGRSLARAQQAAPAAPQANQDLPEKLLLKDYRPNLLW